MAFLSNPRTNRINGQIINSNTNNINTPPFPNIRANRINAQTIGSNFYQGSNADITNIACANLSVANFVFNSATYSGNVVINSTTQSIDPDTGALVVIGGVGIGENLNIGQNLGVTGSVYIGQNLNIGENLGITGTAYIGQDLNILESVYVGENLGVTGNMYIGQDLDVNGNIGITGYFNIYNTTNTNSYGTTGAFTVAGGIVIGENLFVGGTGYFDGDIDIFGNLGVNGSSQVYGDFKVGEYLTIGNSVGPGTSQLHFCYNNGYETGPNFQLNADYNDRIALQHYVGDTITNETNFMSMCVNTSNTSLGYQTLQLQPNLNNNNTSIGYLAGTALVDGTDNTFIGYLTGVTGIGYYNTFLGSEAGSTGLTGCTGCVGVGYQAGFLDYGNYNTFIGYQAGWTGTNHYGGTGLVCIGANAYPSTTFASNECTISTGTTVSRFSNTTGSWTNPSDARDKANIDVIDSGIDLINQIRPSKYRWDKREWYDDGISDGTKKNDDWHSGFIAQQLDEVQTYNQAEYLNLVYKSNPNKLEIASGNLIPVIVKALQDLSNENKELKNELSNLSIQNSQLVNTLYDLSLRIVNLENK